MRKLFALLAATGLFASMSIAPSLACPGDKKCDGSKCSKSAKQPKAKKHKGADAADKTAAPAPATEKPAETK